MKKLLLTFSICLYSVGFIKAQQQTVQEVNLTDQLKKLCNLSPEQAAKVECIVNTFVNNRDFIYNNYRENLVELKSKVKQNRWNYEIALIGILSPSQMGLVKVFDQRNPDLMTYNSRTFNDVSYLKPDENTASTETSNNTVVQAANEQKSTLAPQSLVTKNAEEQPHTETVVRSESKQPAQEVNLTNQIKDLCDLSVDLAAKIDPIVADFTTKRNEVYKKYRHDPATLAKMVKQNRWDYEKALVGFLTPSQMGLVKVFDQRNPDLMTYNSRTVIDVSYFKSTENTTSAESNTAVAQVVTEQKSTPVGEPVVAEKAKEQTNTLSEIKSDDKQPAQEVNLTYQMKELCDLSTEQIAKVTNVVADFVTKRNETYKKYHHDPAVLARMVKQNRWDYEVSLTGILSPSQMGLVKVFDQRNPDLMTYNSGQVNDVSYLADNR